MAPLVPADLTPVGPHDNECKKNLNLGKNHLYWAKDTSPCSHTSLS